MTLEIGRDCMQLHAFTIIPLLCRLTTLKLFELKIYV